MIEPLFIKIFLTTVLILFLIGVIVPMVAVRRKGMNPHGTHEGGSLLTRLTSISIMIWLIYIILYIIFDDYIRNLWSFAFLSFDIYIIIGIIVIIISFIIESLGIKALGLNFRIELPLEETELITSGIYRFIRHPIVFGIFILFIGNFLIIPNLFTLIISIFNIITFNSKVRDEEKFLSTRFGDIYEDYRLKVGRYLPFRIGKRSKKE